jgi:uncharacterized protein (TIGR02284 family)
MVTTVGTEDRLTDLITDLIKLDYDAIDAYNAAIERLDNKTFASSLRSFRDDHQRHTQNLKPFLRELGGGEAPAKGDAKSMLASGKVKIAALVGDKAILMAMKTNEDDTNTAYERAHSHKGLTSELKKVLDSNLTDERRHRAWIVQTTKKL